jgi:hypothetical protein
MVTGGRIKELSVAGWECRKNFSLRRSNFPFRRVSMADVFQKGMSEFQADQVISLGMCHPLRLGLDPAGGPGARRRGRSRRAGDFQQDLRGEPQGATYGDQGPSGGDVPGGRKLKKLFAFLIATPDKNRDR